MIWKIFQVLLAIKIITISTILASLGGVGTKQLRRFIYPAILTIYAYFLLQNWWILTIYIMILPLSLGYGTISPDDDKPSFLGKVAYKLFPKSQVLQNVFCRGIVGKLIALSMLSVPIIKHTYLSYALGSWIIILIWAMISWRNFGVLSVKLFRKQYLLNKSDLICYAVTTSAIVGIIHRIVG